MSYRRRRRRRRIEVVKGSAAAVVSMRAGDATLTALTTRESAEELGLEAGQRVTALVKATDVMIATEGGVA